MKTILRQKYENGNLMMNPHLFLEKCQNNKLEMPKCNMGVILSRLLFINGFYFHGLELNITYTLTAEGLSFTYKLMHVYRLGTRSRIVTLHLFQKKKFSVTISNCLRTSFPLMIFPAIYAMVPFLIHK